jgi:hypothetical protein
MGLPVLAGLYSKVHVAATSWLNPRPVS